MGRRIIDRYPLKTTYVIASALQVVAMLGLAMGNGYVALLGAIFSAVLSAAVGSGREHPDRALHAQPLSRAGLRREVRGGVRREPARHPADRLGAQATGNLDLLFLGLAGTSLVITAGGAAAADRAQQRTSPRAVPQAALPNSVYFVALRRLVGRPRQAAVEPGAGIGEGPEVDT